MTNLKQYPLALQLLMQTDGTVTDLLKLLTNESIAVNKLSEHTDQIEALKVLDRRIFLQGQDSGKNWMFAQSQIFLDHLPAAFVDDLLNKSVPIGTLWMEYRMETFKELVSMVEELSNEAGAMGYSTGTPLLSRVYNVYNNDRLIMTISEKFPITQYVNMI